MTAVLAYLRSLSVAECIGIAAASWLILAALGSAGMARAAHVLKRRVRPAKPESDADWLRVWPVTLTETEARLRFRDIAMNEAGERL